MEAAKNLTFQHQKLPFSFQKLFMFISLLELLMRSLEPGCVVVPQTLSRFKVHPFYMYLKKDTAILFFFCLFTLDRFSQRQF